MSHVATVDVHITDLAALKTACGTLGLEFQSDQTTYRWYGHYLGGYPLPEGFTPEELGRCDHAIRLSNSPHAYEVGVVRRRDGQPGYTLMYDAWHGGFGLEEVIGAQACKLRQQYAAIVALKQARKQGFRVTQIINEEGFIQLTCTR